MLNADVPLAIEIVSAFPTIFEASSFVTWSEKPEPKAASTPSAKILLGPLLYCRFMASKDMLAGDIFVVFEVPGISVCICSKPWLVSDIWLSRSGLAMKAIPLNTPDLSCSRMVSNGDAPVVFTKNPCPGWMYWFNPVLPENGAINVTVPTILTVTYPPVLLRFGSHPQKVFAISVFGMVDQSIGDANGFPSKVYLSVTPERGIAELVLYTWSPVNKVPVELRVVILGEEVVIVLVLSPYTNM